MPSRFRKTTLTAITGLCLLAGASLPGSAATPVKASPGANPDLTDPLHDSKGFAHPPALARPLARWWWSATPLDRAELIREVDALAAAGFGGAEIAFGTSTWATKAQRDGLKAVLTEARRLGLRIDMTYGASWPITTPANVGTLRQQELQYGHAPAAGLVPFNGPVPAAGDDPTNNKGATLVAVTAARVQSEGTPALPPTGTPNTVGSPGSPLVSPVLDPASLTDLTKQVAAGRLTWTPPAVGHWEIFGLWQRPTSQAVASEFDKTSISSALDYIAKNQLGDASAALPGTVRNYFEDSLENVATLFWTSTLLQEFRAQHGYDLRPYLPVLFQFGEDTYPVPQTAPNPDFDLPSGLGVRARRDFYATLLQAYIHNHIEVLQAWSRSHGGASFRTQPAYGLPLNLSASARAVVEAGGVADDESLNAGQPAPLTSDQGRFAFDHFRSLTSGVQQAGGKEINTELGAIFFGDQQLGLPDYKSLMDEEWAAGITRPILHGFDYQHPGAAWPGDDNFGGLVAQSWNPYTFPQWRLFGALNTYWARGNEVLQQGDPRVDVAVLRDGFTTTAATYQALGTNEVNQQVIPSLLGHELRDNEGNRITDHTADSLAGSFVPDPMFDGASLEHQGYRMGFVDSDALTDPRASTSGVLFPHGPRYRALIVDQRSISAKTAQALAAGVRHGLRVVFVGAPPSTGVSAAHVAAEDASVRASMATIRSHTPNVRYVSKQSEAVTALRSLGVTPDVSWTGDQPVYTQHRTSPDSDYYYLWNSGTGTARFTARFATTGAPSRLDLWTGSIMPLGQYESRGASTDVPIALQPGESIVLGFDHHLAVPLHATRVSTGAVVRQGDNLVHVADQAGPAQITLSDGRSFTVQAPAPSTTALRNWHLHAVTTGPAGSTTYDADTGLVDWRNIPALRSESGTGTYSTSMTLPSRWSSRAHRAVIDLGSVAGALRLTVNGRTLNPTVASGTPIDITSALHPGKNHVTVTVATTLKNKVVSEARAGNGGLALYLAQPATQAYGLLGPVVMSDHSQRVVTSVTSSLATRAGHESSTRPLPATGADSALEVLAAAFLAAGMWMRRGGRTRRPT